MDCSKVMHWIDFVECCDPVIVVGSVPVLDVD